MPTMYPGTAVPEWTPADGMPYHDNPTVSNVALEFGRLRAVGDFMAVRDNGLIPGRKYTDTQIGGTEARMHFQGIQRCNPPNDDVLLLTGGDPADAVSHLFVCRLESRPKGRAWGTNLRFSRRPPEGDGLLHIYALDPKMWHAGGTSLLGDLLVVPLEGDPDDGSRVDFYDVTDPLEVRRFPAPLCIHRSKEVGKGGAVALTRLPNQHYLCGVWTDSDHLPRRLDLYLSVNTDLLNGFRPEPLSWQADRMLPAGGPNVAYQTLSFVIQRDGAMFLVGTENTSATSPYVGGDDRVDLLHIEFSPETTHSPRPKLTMPTVTRIAEKKISCERDYANLDAAGGIMIAPDWSADSEEAEGRLSLYAAYHWRIARCMRFIEYSQDTPLTAIPIDDIEQGWVDLFEHPNFRGQRLTISGTQDSAIPDYGEIFVQDSGFSDRVSSVRYQLPPGVTYRLYRDDQYRPKKSQNVALEGDGLVHEIRDLHEEANFDNTVSSSKYD
jgi:hypothetical protein